MTILSALSMMLGSPGMAGGNRHRGRRSGCMSKSFLGTYFGVIEGASEIVKTSLESGRDSQSRAFNRDDVDSCWFLTLTFIVCFINPNAISMIHAICGPADRRSCSPVHHADAVDLTSFPHSNPTVPVGNFITPWSAMLCVSVMFFLANRLRLPLCRRMFCHYNISAIRTSSPVYTLGFRTPVGNRHVQRKNYPGSGTLRSSLVFIVWLRRYAVSLAPAVFGPPADPDAAIRVLRGGSGGSQSY